MIEFINLFLEKANKKNQNRYLVESFREKDSFFFAGKKMLDFSSNDYLGLSHHPYLINRSKEYCEKFGVGATASRLVCGSLPITNKLEEKIASFKMSESSLIFNSGFQANVSILPTLCTKQSLIVMDKYSHNSLIQGSLLSKAKILRYNHNDLFHLEKILNNISTKNFDRRFIVTESLFGMDGNILDIEKLCFLAKKHSAFIYLDEAHATGILGEHGEGLSVKKDILISLGTFGKAFGSFGAFISCSNKMKEFLINSCPGIIFSTALPPSLIGAIEAALEIIPSMDKERNHIFTLAEKFRKELQKEGFITKGSSSHIVPLICKSEINCLKLQEYFQNNGIYSAAIRPPTVPQNSSRIRFSLSSRHQNKDIEKIIELLKNYPEKSLLCQK